jgi:hypothetical protein
MAIAASFVPHSTVTNTIPASCDSELLGQTVLTIGGCSGIEFETAGRSLLQ